MPDSASSPPEAPPPAGLRPRRHPPTLHRAELLVGTAALERLAATRVILFGVGGVGSWCAEALVRSGVGHLTLVDSDTVCITNVNRQLQALPGTVGQRKVDLLRDRLLSISPGAEVEAVPRIYNLASRDTFALESYHYVLDAIDSLSNKVGLIQHASELGCRVFTCMGASQKLDPTRVRVGSLWKSEKDPLAKFVRKRLRRRGFRGEVTCVWSDEPAWPLQPVDSACGTAACFCPGKGAARAPLELDADAEPGEVPEEHEWCSAKAQINGSLVHVTATFGMVLAGLVIKDVLASATPPTPEETPP